MTPPSSLIRPATPADLPGIMAVLQFANFHHIPSAEMPDLDWRFYYVAVDGDRIVGTSGYKILSPTHAKTQLMVVDPAYRGLGLGLQLQTIRLEAMAAQGIQKVTTNADLPPTIAWYQKHFGYVEVGHLPKVHEFGDPKIDAWTTLELDLGAWQQRRESEPRRHGDTEEEGASLR